MEHHCTSQVPFLRTLRCLPCMADTIQMKNKTQQKRQDTLTWSSGQDHFLCTLQFIPTDSLTDKPQDTENYSSMTHKLLTLIESRLKNCRHCPRECEQKSRPIFGNAQGGEMLPILGRGGCYARHTGSLRRRSALLGLLMLAGQKNQTRLLVVYNFFNRLSHLKKQVFTGLMVGMCLFTFSTSLP